ncbi:MAG: helix-turn-helix transcriptional regulator [Patescibacteria group bacterium]|nr:helix-turn-helix transcriptional regulator [Patescibacteria group bacterium]
MGGLRRGSTVPASRDFYVALGANLSRARVRAELTQQDVADELGMTRAAVCNVEQGNTGLPVHRLVEWAAVLCVKLGTIIPKNV